MIRFLLRRLAWFVITLFVVVTISFFLMRAVKGGPFDAERSLHPAIERNIKARYHLDWPKWKQFLQYIGPINLDSEGMKILSRRAPDRKLYEVTYADGSEQLEGEPRPIAHLEATSTPERKRLDGLVEMVATQDESGVLRNLRQSSIDAVVSREGEDPVLAPLFDALYDAHAAQQSDRVERLLAALAEVTGESMPGIPAGESLSEEQALVRQWLLLHGEEVNVLE